MLPARRLGVLLSGTAAVHPPPVHMVPEVAVQGAAAV